MLFACIMFNMMAIALPSLRMSPLLLIRMTTIELFYAAALSFYVVYTHPIGSVMVIFSELIISILTVLNSFNESGFSLGTPPPSVKTNPCWSDTGCPSCTKPLY